MSIITKVLEARKMKGKDPCWSGYKMLGMKTKDGRKVPNCVSEEEKEEEDTADFKVSKSGKKYKAHKIVFNTGEDDGKKNVAEQHGVTEMKKTFKEFTKNIKEKSTCEEVDLVGEELDEAIDEVLSKDASAGEWISDFVHSDNPKFEGKSKEKRKQMALAAYYAAQRNEEIEEGFSSRPASYSAKLRLAKKMEQQSKERREQERKEAEAAKLKEEIELVEFGNNLALRGLHTANPQSIPDYMRSTEKGKKSLADKNKTDLKQIIQRQLGRHPKPNLPEEVEEIDEISTATMSHQGKTTLKHVKNPGVQLRMAAHDVKPGIKGYRDRVALMKAADAQGKLKEAFPGKDYKSVAPKTSTSTFHDVKSTSTGTVYTKKFNPDGTSMGSGSDAAPAPKRGRGRPKKKFAEAVEILLSLPEEDFDSFMEEGFETFAEALEDLTEQELYELKQSLSGNQHMLDKNKNGKLDKQDFKLLRK